MTLGLYLKESKHPFYGSVVALVMFALYEIFLVLEPSSHGTLRNAPEAWVRTMLYHLGINPRDITFVLITLSLLAIPLTYRKKQGFYPRVFFWLVVEALFFGAITGVVIMWVLSHLLYGAMGMQGGLFSQLALSIGAGLFEELFFRVILTSLLLALCAKLFRWRWLAVALAVFLSALAFALAHYIGRAGDVFSVYSFLYRFLGGLWFASLYSTRGFAQVSLTHAFYDIFVVLFA